MDRFPEHNKLANRFETMAAAGLVDVKFFVRNTDEAAAESVCEEVNLLLDAVHREEAAILDFKDAVPA